MSYIDRSLQNESVSQSVLPRITVEEYDVLITALGRYERIAPTPVLFNLLKKLEFLNTKSGDACRPPDQSPDAVGQDGTSTFAIKLYEKSHPKQDGISTKYFSYRAEKQRRDAACQDGTNVDRCTQCGQLLMSVYSSCYFCGKSYPKGQGCTSTLAIQLDALYAQISITSELLQSFIITRTDLSLDFAILYQSATRLIKDIEEVKDCVFDQDIVMFEPDSGVNHD